MDEPGPSYDAHDNKPRIVFSLAADAKDPSVLDEEREKHRRRAAKFGAEYVDPGKVRKELVLESKRERLAREGFATGIDLFSREETDKRAARASRFNITEPQGLEWKADEDEVAKARRAKKFGGTYVPPTEGAMMEMDLFEERKEVGPYVPRRTNSVYVYGVDVMSTGDIMRYFTEYGPTFVEWINDSACVVLFKDEHSAKRALAGLGRALPAEELAGESSAGLDAADPANMHLFWHKGKAPFIKAGTPIPLIFRMATIEDKKDPTAPRKTRELWKQQPMGGRGRKSRKFGDGQAAGFGGGRMDEDGDVQMGDDGEEVGGRGRERRRRKQRTQEGEQVVVDAEGGERVHTGGDDEHMGDAGGEGGGGGEGAKVFLGDKQARHIWGHAPNTAQGQGVAEPSAGEEGGQGTTPAADKLLRRIITAKRHGARHQTHAAPVDGSGAAADVDADAGGPASIVDDL